MAILDFPQDTSQSPYVANGVTYEWDGEKWTAVFEGGGSGGGASVHVGTNPPTGTPTEGDLWWQDEEARLYVYYTDTDSSQWVDASPGGASTDGGGGGTVGNLQQVTDVGNTTTNGATFGGRIDGTQMFLDAEGLGSNLRLYNTSSDTSAIVNQTFCVGTTATKALIYAGLWDGSAIDGYLGFSTLLAGVTNTRALITAAGDFRINPDGTTPSSDAAIDLKADGSAIFNGEVNCEVTTGTRGLLVRGGQTEGQELALFIDSVGSQKARLSVSATDAGPLLKTNNSSNTGRDLNIEVGTGHKLSIDGGNTTLGSDGSASFSSTVSIASTADTALRIGEATVGYKGGWDKSGNLYIGSNLFDSAESKTVEINADGTSNFTGRLSVKDDAQPWIEVGYGTPGSADHRIQWDSAKLTFNADVADDVASSGFIFNVDTERALTIDSDGNGTWTGYVLTGDSTTGTYSVMDDSGIFTSYKAAGTADETTAFQVVRDGNLEYQVRADGEIQIGGTIPAAPNIVLKADGNASFAGKVSTDKYFISHNDDPAVGACYLFDTSDSRTNNVALEISPTNASSNATTRLNYDGSATFAGNVQTLGGMQFGNWAESNSSSINNGTIQTRRDDSNQVFVSYQGGTSTDDQKISFTANGSASFAGDVDSSGFFRSDRAAGNASFITRVDGTTKSMLLAEGDLRLGGTPTNSATANIRLEGATGSASFAGYLTADGINAQPGSGGQGLTVNNPDTNKLAFEVRSNSLVKIGGDIEGNNANIAMNGIDGSAEFAGTIKSTTWPTTGYELASSGGLSLNAADGTSGNMLVLKSGSTTAASITGTGSASFAGKITLTGTSVDGIQFGTTDSAGAITSQTLDDYEEGTFTPVADSGFTTDPFTLSGWYTKIGRVVTVQIAMTGGVWGDGALITGLPFMPIAGQANTPLSGVSRDTRDPLVDSTFYSQLGMCYRSTQISLGVISFTPPAGVSDYGSYAHYFQFSYYA